jgi:hypothetical protein
MPHSTELDTAVIKAALAARAQEFAEQLYPQGKREGRNWTVGDITGTPGRSFKVCITGPNAGLCKDFAGGIGTDLLGAYQEARRVDFRTALVECANWLGSPACPAPRAVCRPAVGRVAPVKLVLPSLERGGRADLHALATARNLAVEAVAIASQRGVLWFYDSSEGRAWLLTDASRLNAQARRLDGKPWNWNGKKAWTLRGSVAAMPIGLPESASFEALALCEGGPDFLAAFHHAFASGLEKFLAPVCMAGAGLRIREESLRYFAQKRVRIFVHDDAAGSRGATMWAAQLRTVAAHIDGFTFDGLTRIDSTPVKDLCGLASISVDSWEANRDAVENCMTFALERRVA